MPTLEKTLKIETSLGILSFHGIPVSNDFNYTKFAFDNGFKDMITNSPENTEKYGGIGFVVYRNHNGSVKMSYHAKKRLEVVFVNGLPLAYSIV